ncbi:MAG TPA: ribulose-phosphate 3-epimerase [Chloroflexota bacterium]|nr:ribulose-phosphate 3-epimerase [Chloroflexota bacterium]
MDARGAPPGAGPGAGPAPAPLEIAPSILAADFARLGEHVAEALEAGARRIHIDVMDGHFVPNLSVGTQVVEALRPLATAHGAILDVHLMIERPERFLAEFARAGADAMTVHVEATPHLFRATETVRQLGKAAGVAINPATPVGALEEILPGVDLVLLMSVDPGFGGQRFIPGSVDKTARMRRLLDERGLGHIPISVDGGVGEGSIGPLARAGASIAVAGSSVFGPGPGAAHPGRRSVAENLARLRAAAARGGR